MHFSDMTVFKDMTNFIFKYEKFHFLDMTNFKNMKFYFFRYENFYLQILRYASPPDGGFNKTLENFVKSWKLCFKFNEILFIIFRWIWIATFIIAKDFESKRKFGSAEVDAMLADYDDSGLPRKRRKTKLKKKSWVNKFLI